MIATRHIWHEGIWNEGYVNKGRMRVFRPDYPRAWTMKGYAFRSHVVWWLATGQVVPMDRELDHIDGNKLNDDFSNLQVLTRSEHRKKHQPTSYTTCICLNCRKPFQARTCRVKERGVKYCGQVCYKEAARNGWHALRNKEVVP